MSLWAILKTFGWETAHFEATVYRRFVDDNLYSLEQRIMLKSLKIILTNNKNIKFMAEIEENGSLSFLDITISGENNKFVTSVYNF